MSKYRYILAFISVFAVQSVMSSKATAEDSETIQMKTKSFATIEKDAVREMRKHPKLLRKPSEPFPKQQSLQNRGAPDSTEDVVCDDTSCSCNGWVSCGILKWYCNGTFSGHGDSGKCS